ncbi:hypothetical protein FQR65_LT17123 [Abscondita terminalis]|nr:hypothetical protein FQR65_LT17123 [Abscondita terminalis]
MVRTDCSSTGERSDLETRPQAQDAEIGTGRSYSTKRRSLNTGIVNYDPVDFTKVVSLLSSSNTIPEWKNNLFIAALSGTHIARLVIKDNKVVGEERLLADQGQRFRAVIEGKNGELFAVTDAGWLLDGKRFLIDPVFSGNASPIPGTNTAFKGADIYKPEDMPAIDYLLITHDHYDHLDYETILALKGKIDTVICGLGVGGHFEKLGGVFIMCRRKNKGLGDRNTKRLFPVHSSKFMLAQHPWDEPLSRTSKLAAEKGIPLVTPMIGEVVRLTDPEQVFKKWWEGVE